MATSTADLKLALKKETELLQVTLEQNFVRQGMQFDSLKPGVSTFTKGVQMKDTSLKFFPSITSQTITTQTQIQHASATRSAGMLTDLLGSKVEVPDLQELLKVSNLSKDSLEALARHGLDSVNFWDPSNFSTEGLTARNMLKALDEIALRSSTIAHRKQVIATKGIADESGGRFNYQRLLSAGACAFCIMLAEGRNYDSWHKNCGCSVAQIPILD